MDRRYPAGRFVLDADATDDKRQQWIGELDALPRAISTLVASLTDEQLNTPYRAGGWTPRQVVHHVADSHLNAFVRIKLALTEQTPTIKTYEEQLWAELPDARSFDVTPSLAILDGVHRRLTILLDSLTPAQFARPAFHPANGLTSVDGLVQMYAWHCRHHLAHIRLVQEGR